MIDKIRIQNFKSIEDLEIDLGRINVIIGANGCGKTNILEAIAMASAASQRKLDDEFLSSRIRLTEPEFMFSKFEESNLKDKDFIHVVFYNNQKTYDLKLGYIEENEKDTGWYNNIVLDHKNKSGDTTFRMLNEKAIDPDKKLNDKQLIDIFFNMLSVNNPPIPFLIYSPEESRLRNFSDETQIRPLGRKGDGLFQHLKELLSGEERERILDALNEGLSLLDWFQGFDIPKDLFTNEFRLDISDRFISNAKQIFDQRSTNEGFLYLLFYLTLFNSRKTPSFFAVDNIEASFNPKLTKEFIRHLISVAKKNDKQVILTTHSPYVLDGLDLSDDEQRLFVARRDIDGHTRIERVPYRENRTMQLSELWMSGLIGGIPDNF